MNLSDHAREALTELAYAGRFAQVPGGYWRREPGGRLFGRECIDELVREGAAVHSFSDLRFVRPSPDGVEFARREQLIDQATASRLDADLEESRR